MRRIQVYFSLTIGFILPSPLWAGPQGGHSRPPLFEPKIADKSKATIPDKTKLLTPKPLSKIDKDSAESTVLTWEPIPNATSYRIQIATDANFKWLVTDVLSHEGTSYPMAGLEKGKQYFWRVAGVKRDNDAGYIQGHFTWSSFETK